jgi:hypothetical protein
VNEGARVERITAAPAAKLGARQPPEVVINNREEPIQRVIVAPTVRCQQQRHLVRRLVAPNDGRSSTQLSRLGWRDPGPNDVFHK